MTETDGERRYRVTPGEEAVLGAARQLGSASPTDIQSLLPGQSRNAIASSLFRFRRRAKLSLEGFADLISRMHIMFGKDRGQGYRIRVKRRER